MSETTGQNEIVKSDFKAEFADLLDVVSKRVNDTDFPQIGGLTRDTLLFSFKMAIRQNPKLIYCQRQSLIESVENCAILGLAPGSSSGAAYFVPFWDNKAGFEKCQLIVGYRGLVDLMCRTGDVSNVMAHLVYDGDQFDVELGTDPKIHHVPKYEGDRETRPVTHAYSVLKFRDRSTTFEVMTQPQIEAIRLKSKLKDGPAWKYNWHEMARKTVVRRIYKYTRTNPLADHAVRLIDDAEGFDPSTMVVAQEHRSRNDELDAKLGIEGRTQEPQEPQEEPEAEQDRQAFADSLLGQDD